MKIMVEISARHAHISAADLAVLFGEGATLTPKKELSQPGQFVCEEKIEVIGPKGSFFMSILGPTRPETQVEISLSDARKMGVATPIRESGDLDGSPGCVIKGPKGEVTLEKGLIAAKRHIHMTPEDAERFGITDKQVVSVETDYSGRKLLFADVVCRVNPAYSLAMHIDTDEANAAALPMNAEGEVIA